MAYNVKFLKGIQVNFEALKLANALDKNTFYFVDEKDLYLGEHKLTNDADIKNAVSRLEIAETNIQDIFAELDLLQGGEGSISKQLDTLRTELLAKIEANEAAIQAEVERALAAENSLSGLLAELNRIVSENETDIEGKVSTLGEKVSANESAIEGQGSALAEVSARIAKLVGEDANKSARTIANEELAKQLIPENAKEAMDTLEEIAAWIQAHPSDAAEMNEAIQSNSEALALLRPLVEDNASALESLQGAIAALGATVGQNSAAVERHEASLASILDEATGLLAQSVDYTDGAIEALELGTASKMNVEDFDAAGSAAAALESARAYTDGALTWGEIEVE